MINTFAVDLHIHTCLSPCGESSMQPAAIISRAKERQLHAIGISDHNSAENVQAVKAAGKEQNFTVIGGMEITSQEEIHILAFPEDRGLSAMQSIVYAHLPGKNNREIWGRQYVVDKEGYVITEQEKLLIGATTLSLEQIVAYIHGFGGIAITSHIDKPHFSILSQLGFIPAGIKPDALEISPFNKHQADTYAGYGYPLVAFSDAHDPDTIGASRTAVFVNMITVAELKLALAHREGRSTEAEIWKN